MYLCKRFTIALTKRNRNINKKIYYNQRNIYKKIYYNQ